MIEEMMLAQEWEVAPTKSVEGTVMVTVTPVASVFAPRTIRIFIPVIVVIVPFVTISMTIFVTIVILMMVIVAIIVLMMVIVTTVMVILVVAIALVPMVFAVTVVVLSKVSMVNVVVRSSSVMAAAISSAIAAVSMTAIPSAIRPTSIAMVTMLLVPMPLMFTVLGMVVPKPQQGVELLVELVVIFVVRVNLVQMLAKLLTKSDDGWAVRAIGKLASGWSSGVFDLQGEILLAPALQKSSHQVIEALRVVHTHAMSLLFLLWLFVLVTPVLFLVRASLVASSPGLIIVVLLIIVITVMVIFVVVVDFLFLDLLFLLVLEPVALLLFLAVVLRGGAETGVFALLGLLPVPET